MSPVLNQSPSNAFAFASGLSKYSRTLNASRSLQPRATRLAFRAQARRYRGSTTATRNRVMLTHRALRKAFVAPLVA